MPRLAGKVALVTGAAGAFGRRITETFVQEGAVVVATDLDSAALSTAFAALGDKVRTARHDVVSPEDWAQACGIAIESFGGLDVVVNNAGIAVMGGPQDPENISLEHWRGVMRVNADGVMLGCQAAIRAMKERGGSIINLSSIAALNPSPKMVAYGASKAAVRHITRTVAAYCAQSGYAIRCNSIHPGWIPTDMTRASRTPEEIEAQKALIPMRRFGEPQDIADAILYLASDESRYVTGTRLVVDGGVVMD